MTACGPPARFTYPRPKPMTYCQRMLQLLAAGEVIGALAGAIAAGWPLLAAVPGLALTAAVQLTLACRRRRGGGKAMALPVALAALCVLVTGWIAGLLTAPLLVLAAALTGMAALVWNVASGESYDRQSRANAARTMEWADELERDIADIAAGRAGRERSHD